MNGRTFLQTLAATPLVFGLDGLFAQDAKKSPEWLRQALARIKETGRYGIVLVVPGDEKERRKLGEALWELSGTNDADAREILCEAVFICVPKFAEKGNRHLLDTEGKVIASDTVSVETLDSAEKFVESFRKFLHGEKNERLEAQAATIRKNMDEKMLTALKQIDSDLPEGLEGALSLLEKNGDTIIPVLVLARLKVTKPEWLAWIRSLLRTSFEKTDMKKPGSRLPYGTSRPRFLNVCGHVKEIADSDPGLAKACGMAAIEDRGRKFLKFLAE